MSVVAAVAIGRRIEGLTSGTSRLPNTLAVLAFAVSCAALLVMLAGVHGFQGRHLGGASDDIGEVYVGLAFCAAGLLAAPILTLGGVAARLTAGRRDQRLASLRLAGATQGQVSSITLWESGRLAALGSLIGVGLYGAAIPLLARIPFEGRPFGAADLLVPWWWIPLAVLGIVLLALVSGLISLRRVSISPLGVAQRQTPPGLALARVVITGVAGVVWLAIGSSLGQAAAAVIMVLLAGLVGTLNVVGPFVMMLLGRLVARWARTPQTLLAARRMVDDPRATWRSVGALGLGVIVAGIGGSFTGIQTDDAESAQVLIDMKTGSLVTLGIIAVIAATSTGVVHAARVIDRRRELAALTLAGVDTETLTMTSRREATLPLAITVLLSGVLCLLIMAPFASALGPLTLVWFLAAVGVSVGLMLAAIHATTPLVRDAVRQG